MFILICPRCDSVVYDPVKRYCPEVPLENQSDVYCDDCGWVGKPDELVKRAMEFEISEEESVEEETDSGFEWEIER
jgi:methionyl-tRNA synthetase